MSGNGHTVLWQPQAGPQKALIDCPLPEIFYGGARGGGKTDGILGKYALKAAAFKDKFNAVFFRKEMPQQDDLIDRAKEIYIPLGAQWLEAKKRFNFPGGGRVRFRPMETVADAEKYQGQNLSDASVEEAGNYPSSAPIDRLFGALRSTAGVPVQMILTANPGGPGHHWIKQRFVEPAPYGFKILRRKLPNGQTHNSVFIPSLLKNNRILLAKDPGYASRLHLVGSPELVRAWLEGDWDVIAGAYFPEFTRAKHVLVDADFPKEWRRFTATDWGSSRPFWTGWFVIVQKEMPAQTVTGQTVTLLPGALVCYREWYGESKEQPSQNIGLKLPIEEWAKGVLERCRGEEISYHTVDTSMFSEDGGPSLAERAMKVNVRGKRLMLRRADKRRLPGWNQVRYRLRGDAEGLPPMLFFTQFCPDAIRTIAALQHDDMASRFEDASTEGDDHACDGIRYACMSRPRQLPDPRAIQSGPKPGTLDWLVAEAWKKKPKGYNVDA